VRDIPVSPIHTLLRLSGVVKHDREHRLRIRNRIYREVFNEHWVGENMPIGIKRIFGFAAIVVLLVFSTFWFLGVLPRP